MVDWNIAQRSKIREESFKDGDESRHRLGEVVIRKWLEEKEEVGTPSQLFFSQTQNYCQLLFRLDRQHLQNKSCVLHPYCEGLSVNFACISGTNCLEIGLLSKIPESHFTHIWLTHKERGYCVQIQNIQKQFFVLSRDRSKKMFLDLAEDLPTVFLLSEAIFCLRVIEYWTHGNWRTSGLSKKKLGRFFCFKKIYSSFPQCVQLLIHDNVDIKIITLL